MGRPIIGITGELEAARWRTWIREAVVSPVSYTRAVERAGGTPVVLPPVPASSVPGLIARIDGLVVAAGRDVDPSLYDEAAHEQTDQPDHRRDRFELLMIRAAIEADLPFLAIARGMQLLNVARGGTLVQHLPDRLGNESHKPDPVKLTVHDVQVSPDSKLSQILGTTAQVPAAHHQAINSIGSGLVTVAWTLDQVVEAVEVQGHKFGIGVQWFPEEGDDLRLFEALMTAAKAAPAPQPAEVPSRSKRSSKRHAARSLAGGNRGRLLFRAVGPEPLSRLLPAELIGVVGRLGAAELIGVAIRLSAAELVRMRHLDLHPLVGCGLGW